MTRHHGSVETGGPSPPPAAPVVLIVDDLADARELLEQLLAPDGYELELASSGAEAIAKAEARPPDLILLDVMMQGMDGYQTCKALRAHRALAEVPVIMVTALDDRQSKVRGIQAGADDFISKPIDETELRARVRTVTRLNRFRRLLWERKRFEWIVANAEEGFVVADPGDHILFANARARELLELPVGGDADGASVSFLEHARRSYRCEPEWAWADWPAEASRSERLLLRPESAGSSPVWLHVSVLAQEAGAPSPRLVRLKDVTEKVIGLRELRTFHSLVAHKLRNPLTAVLSCSEVLARGGLGGGEVKELADVIRASAEVLHRDTESVLRLLHSPRPAGAAAAFELRELPRLLGEVSHGMQLDRVGCVGGMPSATLRGLDEEAVAWVLRELLENARKFHPRFSPRVEVSARSLGPRFVLVRVADDGVTLTPEQLRRAWTPFFQGEGRFTGQVPGLGVGLAAVASLVSELGGSCRLANREDGPGVVVELTLSVV